MYIVYGGCINFGGHQCVLILVDCDNLYFWTHGMCALSGEDMIKSFQ